MIAEGELVLVRTPLAFPFSSFVGVLFLQLALGNSALRNWALSPSAEAQLPSIFFSGSLAPASTRHAVGLFLTYAAVYFLVVNQFRERLQIDRLVRFLLVMGSLLAFYGLLDYLGGGYGVFGSKKLSYAGRVTGHLCKPGPLCCLARNADSSSLSAFCFPPSFSAGREGAIRLRRRLSPCATTG